MSPKTLILLASIVCSSPNLIAQVLERTIHLTDGNPATSDNPFGIALDPDGVHAYVPLAGDLAPFFSPPSTWNQYNNDQVVKVDIYAGTHVAQGTAGLFPEDAAITRTPAGQPRHVYVSNSSDGTVTCFTPDLVFVATIPLSPCGGAVLGAVFPFGLLAWPDSTHVLVTSYGCNNVDIIDTDPGSASFNQVVSTFQVSGGQGRPQWAPFPFAVIPVQVCDPGFNWCQAGITVVDVTQPALQNTYSTTPIVNFVYPGVTDIAVEPNGLVLLAESFNGPRLVEMDPANGTITRTLDLGPQVGQSLHGIGLSASGRLCVITSLTSLEELVFVDVATWSVVSVIPTQVGGVASGPNEVVFTPDESRVVVTLQNLGQVRIYRDLPLFDLTLEATPQAPLGGMVDLRLDNAEHGQPVVIYTSVVGPGPQAVGNQTVLLSDPLALLVFGNADLNGNFEMLLPVPQDPVLANVTFYLQGATVDRSGAIRLSNGAVTLLN